MAALARVERTDFLSPMCIGEVAHVSAEITYTSKHSVEVQVHVMSENILTGNPHAGRGRGREQWRQRHGRSRDSSLTAPAWPGMTSLSSHLHLGAGTSAVLFLGRGNGSTDELGSEPPLACPACDPPPQPPAGLGGELGVAWEGTCHPVAPLPAPLPHLPIPAWGHCCPLEDTGLAAFCPPGPREPGLGWRLLGEPLTLV